MAGAAGRHRRGGSGWPGALEGRTQPGQVLFVDPLALNVLVVVLLIAEDPLERRAGVLHVPTAVHHEDEVADVLDQRAEAALARDERLLRLSAHGHVVGHRFHGDQLAQLIAQQHTAVFEPGVGAVCAPPADRHQRLGLLHGLVDDGEVVGVHELPPQLGIGVEVLRRQAQDAAHAGAHVLELEVGNDAEAVAHEVLRAFDEQPEALVTGPQLRDQA